MFAASQAFARELDPGPEGSGRAGRVDGMRGHSQSGPKARSDRHRDRGLKLLVPEMCSNECLGGTQAVVWFQLANKGAGALTAGATVEVHGTTMKVEKLLATKNFDQQLAPGEVSAGQSVLVDIAGLDSLRLVAKPGEEECVVDPADELVLVPPFCTAPG